MASLERTLRKDLGDARQAGARVAEAGARRPLRSLASAKPRHRTI